MLHVAWAALAIVLLHAISILRRRRVRARLMDAALDAQLRPAIDADRPILRAVLQPFAVLLLAIALGDPRWGSSVETVSRRGLDVMIVLDLSKSMLAEDARPSRLGTARQMVLDLLDAMRGDRAGLVTFAGSTTLACPLTIDHGALRQVLAEVDARTAPRGGSLLGDAIRLAASSFTDEVRDHKAIIVLTDGEDHDSAPIEAARAVHERSGIPIVTIGLGDAQEGARIPAGDGRWVTYQGQEVWSKMNESLLRDLALATDGAFVPAGTRTIDMSRFYDTHLAGITRREGESRAVRKYFVRYQWFAAPALFLLLLETYLAQRGGIRRFAPDSSRVRS